MSTGRRHQLFATLRADSTCDTADLDTWAWSSVSALCRSLDWTIVCHDSRSGDADTTVTSVLTDRCPDPIVIRTFWQHACTLVDIPPVAVFGDPTTAAVLEFEFTDSSDFAVVAGASHPIAGHLISIRELLWFESGRRHWEQADLGATLEELD